ncbi:MAG: DUF362 domain-containing protein [Candidatus Nanoarchaeia archaeon]|jgi:hypothetical protein
MSEVIFSKDFDNLLNNVDFSKLGKRTAIKLHFGERGCTTFLNPSYAKRLYDKIKKPDNVVELIECNALYKGSRSNKTNHLKIAKEHGFDFAPIKILDGELGNEYVNIDGCKLGKGIKDYDSLIVLTHFKGHMMAGLGGALKNVGMGLGSRAGKLDMHSTIKPSVNEKKCIACGACVKSCPASAIILDKKARISPKVCIGCATCIEVCPENAINIPWSSSSPERLQERICDYSKAILSLFKNVIFINCLINITPQCDCHNSKQKILCKDIGFLYSKNIVSIDSCSKDLFTENDLLKNNVKKFMHFIDYAEKIKLGSKKYNLINK